MSSTWNWMTGLPARFGVALLAVLVMAGSSGCGSGKGAGVVDYFGHYHPAGWMNEHSGKALTNVGNCTQCHEISVIKVGSGVPTCMTTGCHHGTVPGWANPAVHGLRAKLAAGPSGGSLVSCQTCHGKDFSGGGSANACVTCHGVKAPHPAKPWRISGGSVLTHTSTDTSNAAVCAQCHYLGSPSNPVGHPATPAPAGTQPGCYNATLCHGSAPHLIGVTWTDPKNAGTTDATFHGIPAKADLLYCQTCHGVPGTTKFEGGTTTTACSSCHTQAKAHSDSWYKASSGFASGTYIASHRTAAAAVDVTKRAAVCGLCHGVTAGATSPVIGAPGCFSASFNTNNCHANGPGAAAHPSPFLGGLLSTGGNSHQTVTLAQFNGECINCHDQTGTGSTKVGPSCITCHIVDTPLAASKGPGTCLSCHSDPNFKTQGPAGTTFPNIAGAHAKHLGLLTVLTCATCHAGSQPGEGGANQPHYTGANRGPNGTPIGSGPAPVTMNALFKAQTGTLGTTPSLSAFTCNAVSCHGGQTTPGWQTGKLTVDATAYCMNCHVIPGVTSNQFNDARGTHSSGAHPAATCAACHDMSAANINSGAINHFKYLDTPVATASPDQLSSGTIKIALSVGAGNGMDAGGTYAPLTTIGNGNCALTCHVAGTTKIHSAADSGTWTSTP